MEISQVSYHKTFNLGNYSNEKIGVDIKLGPDENALDAFAEAKKLVEKSHRFFVEQPQYESAKRIIENPDDFTGNEVKRAHEVIIAFESNYPDLMSRFTVSRQLTEGPKESIDDYDHHD